MLSDAESLGQKYAREVAKRPPPSNAAQTKNLLAATSSWFSIDLETVAQNPCESMLETLGNETLWQILQDLGIDGLYLQNLKLGGNARTGFEIDPKWGVFAKESIDRSSKIFTQSTHSALPKSEMIDQSWSKIKDRASAYGIALVGDTIGAVTGPGLDFELALENVDDYAELYHLIQIDKKDYSLLPKVPVGMKYANVPWLKLEDLYKKGYIPESARPYTKESAWNATAKIQCPDGEERRWIYLKENQNDPVLAWLSAAFAADRIASADALDSVFRLGQKVLKMDAKIPAFAKKTSALWIRKIGGYSAASTNGTLAELKSAPTDLAFDVPTQPALLHALIAEDTEALRLIYKLYLQEGIATSKLVHALEPFTKFPCDWTEFLMNPKKRYHYREEKITGELLRDRLLKEDLYRLKGNTRNSLPISTWGGYCALAFEVAEPKEFQKKQDLIQKAHLLLAFTYAMQPGVFSLSAADLVGALPDGENPRKIDLFGPNENALYPSLPCQMQSPRTFASHLKKILAVRASSKIASGKLIEVCPVDNQGTLLLLHRVPESGFFHLLAVNFSRSPVQEKLKLTGIENSWAIDLMSGLTAQKGFDSGVFFFDLPPLSGKVFLFQPKYYD
jgi:trehalose synthase